jgi:hypothetical protein
LGKAYLNACRVLHLKHLDTFYELDSNHQSPDPKFNNH